MKARHSAPFPSPSPPSTSPPSCSNPPAHRARDGASPALSSPAECQRSPLVSPAPPLSSPPSACSPSRLLRRRRPSPLPRRSSSGGSPTCRQAVTRRAARPSPRASASTLSPARSSRWRPARPDGGRIATAVARFKDYLARFDRMKPAEQARQGERPKLAMEERDRLSPQIPKARALLAAGCAGEAPWSGATGPCWARPRWASRCRSTRRSPGVDPGAERARPGTTRHDRGGRDEGLTLALKDAPAAQAPASPPTPPAPAIVPAPAPAPPDAPEVPAGRRTALYLAGGLGARGLVLGGITGAIVLGKKGTIDEHCGSGIQAADPKAPRHDRARRRGRREHAGHGEHDRVRGGPGRGRDGARPVPHRAEDRGPRGQREPEVDQRRRAGAGPKGAMFGARGRFDADDSAFVRAVPGELDGLFVHRPAGLAHVVERRRLPRPTRRPSARSSPTSSGQGPPRRRRGHRPARRAVSPALAGDQGARRPSRRPTWTRPRLTRPSCSRASTLVRPSPRDLRAISGSGRIPTGSLPTSSSSTSAATWSGTTPPPRSASRPSTPSAAASARQLQTAPAPPAAAPEASPAPAPAAAPPAASAQDGGGPAPV